MSDPHVAALVSLDAIAERARTAADALKNAKRLVEGYYTRPSDTAPGAAPSSGAVGSHIAAMQALAHLDGFLAEALAVLDANS